MSEICLKCLNELLGTNYSKRKFIISKDLDLCEECGEWKNIVVARKKGYFWRRSRLLFNEIFCKKNNNWHKSYIIVYF